MEKCPIKILLVEDNPGDVRLFKICLEDYGREDYSVTNADSFENAIRELRNNNYDLVITDLGLPDSTGIETFTKINKAYPSIPIIVLTGQDDETLGLEAVKNGAQDFLTKNYFADPGSQALLTRSIKYAIERKKSEEKLQELNNELEERVQQRTRQLRESQQLYNAVAQNYPNGTINVLDKGLKYVFAEGKDYKRKGIDKEKLIGTSFLERFGPDNQNDLEFKLNQVFTGKSQNFEIKVKNDIYELNAVPLIESPGKIDQILVVKTNITKQKKAEEEVLNALKKAKELNELKSRFVSMASHEFRTPLSIVLSSASLIEKYNDIKFEDKRLRNVRRIKSSVKNLNIILEEFLSIDKVNSGKEELHPEQFDIIEFCEDLTESMQTAAKLGQELVFDFNGNRRTVSLDKTKLRNIIINFLSNAIKYSPENQRIDFHVELLNAHLSITVKDRGIGIPMDEQKNLFEHFFRAKNALNIQGTGLGLNIVKKYVEMMNGSIEFESEQDKGSVFTVNFPQ